MPAMRWSLVLTAVVGAIISATAAATAVAASEEMLSTLLRQPRAQPLQGRILNGAQFVQHSESAQSFYLPPDLSTHSPRDGGQATNQLEPEVIQVQVPADEKKILLRLPAQQQQQQQQQQQPLQQQQFAAYQHLPPPPRRHYKIILVRSPPVQKAAPPPPAALRPEVEEQTLIYVLVKKPDEPNAAELQALQQMQQNAVKLNKPEVYFIKYKANEQPQQQQQSQQVQHQQQQTPQPVSSVVAGSTAAQQEQISNIIQRQLQRTSNGGDAGASEQPHNSIASSGGYP